MMRHISKRRSAKPLTKVFFFCCLTLYLLFVSTDTTKTLIIHHHDDTIFVLYICTTPTSDMASFGTEHSIPRFLYPHCCRISDDICYFEFHVVTGKPCLTSFQYPNCIHYSIHNGQWWVRPMYLSISHICPSIFTTISLINRCICADSYFPELLSSLPNLPYYYPPPVDMVVFFRLL